MFLFDAHEGESNPFFKPNWGVSEKTITDPAKDKIRFWQAYFSFKIASSSSVNFKTELSKRFAFMSKK